MTTDVFYHRPGVQSGRQILGDNEGSGAQCLARCERDTREKGRGDGTARRPVTGDTVRSEEDQPSQGADQRALRRGNTVEPRVKIHLHVPCTFDKS